RLNASEAVAGRPPTRQSQPAPDCRAATFQKLVHPLRDTSAATIMPLPRPWIPHPDCRCFLSRLPRYTRKPQVILNSRRGPSEVETREKLFIDDPANPRSELMTAENQALYLLFCDRDLQCSK